MALKGSNLGLRIATRPRCRPVLRSRGHRRWSSTTSSSPDIYDVVTVGGGPVGLAFLAALKASPVTGHLKTALIETQDLSKLHQWTPPEHEFSNRASSLTPSSVTFLETIGAWPHVDHARIQPYDEMQVWDASNDAAVQFDWGAETRAYNAPPQTIATMTENSNLTRALLNRVAELDADASLMASTKLLSINDGENDPDGIDLSAWPILTLESARPPSRIAARLLVGADGVNSPVRGYAGITSRGWDYGRHGVVATLTTRAFDAGNDDAADFDLFSTEPLGNRATAYQRFLSQLGGPIAVLPLPDNHASLVWSTTPARAAYLKSLPPPAQVAMVNAALRLSQVDLAYLFSLPPSSPDAHESELQWRLQHTPAPALGRHPPVVVSVQPNSVASFPLRFRHASALVGPRVALIGDAAHTIHPLAGQGLNLGLADAQSLASCVEYAVSHGMDVGDTMALESFAAARFSQGLVMAGAVDALNSLYQLGGGGSPMMDRLAGQARAVGMKLVNGVVPGLKELIMKQAN